MGSDPEQEDEEKGSQSCPQPRVSLQLPKGELETWSSGAGGMVIKVEIEPLHPNLMVSPGLEEAVSVRGMRAYGQQGKLGCRQQHTQGSAADWTPSVPASNPVCQEVCRNLSKNRLSLLRANCPFLQDNGPGAG